ncbi:MAG: preprotein translocase [Bacteroidota bacterium]|nr:preprotein translocase [Bacteroidota bacterium]
MKYLFTFCCLLFTAYSLKAEENDSIQIKNNILFFRDPRVDILQKIYARKTPGPRKGATRVQVFQATSRDKVFEAKMQFSAHFPGIMTYVTYAPPNFKLRAGDFETQQEAYKFLQQVKPLFPASFVIEEKIVDDDKKYKPKNY